MIMQAYRFQSDTPLPFHNIHSLRHLHASILIFEGIDVVAVSADMGHSVVGTTLNLYSHMFQEAKARNCDAISTALNFVDTDSFLADNSEDETSDSSAE